MKNHCVRCGAYWTSRATPERCRFCKAYNFDRPAVVPQYRDRGMIHQKMAAHAQKVNPQMGDRQFKRAYSRQISDYSS